MIDVFVPLSTVNPLNRREHPFARAKRVRHEKAVTLLALRGKHGPSGPTGPVIVTLTRVSPRAMDSDGAIAALKSVRDAVAEWLGRDDRDTAMLVWAYVQEKGAKGVRIAVEVLHVR